MPLVGAAAVQFDQGQVEIAHSAVGVERRRVAIAVPCAVALGNQVKVAAAIYANLIAVLPAGVAAVEGVPLIGAGGVQLQHVKVIDAAAVGVQGRRVAVPQPGFRAQTDHRDAPVGSYGNIVAIFPASIGAVEGVPLVSAAAVQLEHVDIPEAAVGVQGRGSAIAQPGIAAH